MTKSAPKAFPKTKINSTPAPQKGAPKAFQPVYLSDYSQSLNEITLKSWPDLDKPLAHLEQQVVQRIKQEYGMETTNTSQFVNIFDQVYPRQVFTLVHCYKAALALGLNIAPVIAPLVDRTSEFYSDCVNWNEFKLQMPEEFSNQVKAKVSGYFNAILVKAASSAQSWEVVDKVLNLMCALHYKISECLMRGTAFDEEVANEYVQDFDADWSVNYPFDVKKYVVNSSNYPLSMCIRDILENPPELVPSFEGLALSYNPNFKEMIDEFFEKASPVIASSTTTLPSDAGKESDDTYKQSCARIRQALKTGLDEINDSYADIDVRAQVLLVLYYLKKAIKKPVLKTEKSVKKFNERLLAVLNVDFTNSGASGKALQKIFKNNAESLNYIAHNPDNWHEVEGIRVNDLIEMSPEQLLNWISEQ